METVYRDYRDKDVQFFYVYKAVQHPELNNFVSAFTIEERLKHVAHAKKLFQTEIPWICDNMENEVKHVFGGAPNGEFVLDPEGKIVRKRFWSNPDTLRNDLIELVGPVDKITTVEDLPTRFVVETREIASGVVPRISLPGALRPLIVRPEPDDDNPYLVKLRAEATSALMSEGKGQLYLGLYLDPLYNVHWNNRAGRPKIQIEASDGVVLESTDLIGPEVAADKDIDPRQFLIDVDRGDSKKPLKLTVTYTVCDDAETYCITVTQKYKVRFKSTRDLGSRPGIFMPAMFAKVREMDKNGDGNLTVEELPPGRVSLYIGHMDYDGNQVIEKAEIDQFLKMFNNGRGFDSEFNDGQGENKTDRDDSKKSDKANFENQKRDDDTN